MRPLNQFELNGSELGFEAGLNQFWKVTAYCHDDEPCANDHAHTHCFGCGRRVFGVDLRRTQTIIS